MRVVVIAGAGKAFCAGHDLKEMGADLRDEPIRALFERCSRMMAGLTRLPQPVIARVHGIATAAGCQLVAACDLAVCSDDSRFATSGVKYGLFCSTPMVALSRNVPRKAGHGDAADRRLHRRCRGAAPGAGQPGGAAGRARRRGRRRCARDCSTSRAAVLALGKRAFYRQLELGLDAAYALTTEVIVANALGADFAEGVEAFTAKRKPVWPDA